MNARKRVLAVLERKPVDRLPVDLWHTPEVLDALKTRFGVEDDFDVYRAMELDKIVWVFMDYSGEREGDRRGAQVGAQASGARTLWGAPLKEVNAGAATYQEFGDPPLAICETREEVEDYSFWPDPDKFDYDAAVELAKGSSREFAAIGPWVSLFEVYCQLRGMEQSLMDLLVSPDLAAAILDKIEACQTEMMTRFFERASDYLDMTFISDDVGSQTGLLFSPEIWDRHLRERIARWCGLIHSYGIKVFYHTDGAAEPLIAPLIECGVDVLNPIQHVCPGMDMAALKQNYGDKIIFHGGVDNQSVLPFGTVEQVREETMNCLQSLGKGREGYICCSCHNVQPGTPIENIFTMVETAKKF